MKATPTNADDWVGTIATKAKVSPEEVQAVLDRHGILPQAALPRRRQLRVAWIALAGRKQGTDDDRDISFRWPDGDGEMGAGLWAFLSDRNSRGKSSLLNLIQAALRGEFPGNVKPDVWGWLSLVEVAFRIDATLYRVRVEKDAGEVDPRMAWGTLSRGEGDARIDLYAGPADKPFEKAVADNMMEEFGFGSFHAFNKANGPRTHGWNAIATSFFVHGPGTAVFGNVTRDGVPLRLLQMFMGLPWITTYSAASTAFKKASAEGGKASSADPATGRLAERLKATEQELDDLRARSATRVDRPRLRLDLVARDRETMRLRAAVTLAEERVDTLDRQASAARESVAEVKRTLQQMRDELAAGMVFRRLRPVCCPSCDNGLDAKRYDTAEGGGTCALCGEKHVEEDDDGPRIDDLQADVREAEQVVARLNAELAAARKRLREAEAERDANQTRIGEIAAELASAEDPDAEFRVRALEAQAEQLREIIAEVAAPATAAVPDDAAVLRQVEKVTQELFGELQRDVLKEVSDEVAALSHRFGVQHVESMHWSGNNVLAIRQGGADITFSDLSPGENLRVRIAAALAVVAVARRRRFGRYPGLLVLDSPRSQEMTDDDFAALMASVQEVINEAGDAQVIVGAATKPTLLGVVPGQQTLHAEGSRFLF
ncbi:hypothetical protein ACSD7O_19350 [Methylorubrum extorquens]|uniref:hypothetical protein n=1 Tax=Methylorubrum extorquens TaxID=408 RepID=UPI003F5F0E75